MQYYGKKVRGYVHLGTVIEILMYFNSLLATAASPMAWLPQHLSKMISIDIVDVCVCMQPNLSFQIIYWDTKRVIISQIDAMMHVCRPYE